MRRPSHFLSFFLKVLTKSSQLAYGLEFTNSVEYIIDLDILLKPIESNPVGPLSIVRVITFRYWIKDIVLLVNGIGFFFYMLLLLSLSLFIHI